MKLTSGFYHDSVWLVIGVDFLFARPKVHCVGGTLESSWPVEETKFKRKSCALGPDFEEWVYRTLVGPLIVLTECHQLQKSTPRLYTNNFFTIDIANPPRNSQENSIPI